MRPWVLLVGETPRLGDLALGLVAGAATGLAAALSSGSPWLGGVAADVGAGIIANVSTSTAQWYANKARWLHFTFVVLHSLHVAVATWATGAPWTWGLALFLAMAAGVGVVRLVPVVVAPASALCCVVIGAAFVPALPAFPAFGALFLLKLVYGFGLHARRP